MQQRQLRLGDILDDYCPRERRVTNHAVVAMVGPEVKQTRCTTCEAEHEYKHAKVPRQRRKDAPAALYSQVLTSARKPTPADASEQHEPLELPGDADQAIGEAAAPPQGEPIDAPVAAAAVPPAAEPAADEDLEGDAGEEAELEEGPVHRPLIRATLPRPEGQPPAARPAPEFTIRQPGGRSGRFRPRHGVQSFHGPRSNGNVGGPMRGGLPRQGGRPPMPSRQAKRHDGGRKRSK